MFTRRCASTIGFNMEECTPRLSLEWKGAQTGYSRYALTSDLGEMEIFEMEVILASKRSEAKVHRFG